MQNYNCMLQRIVPLYQQCIAAHVESEKPYMYVQKQNVTSPLRYEIISDTAASS